jgi:hypothetical protein
MGGRVWPPVSFWFPESPHTIDLQTYFVLKRVGKIIRPTALGNNRAGNYRGNFIFARISKAFAAVTVRQKP